MTDTLPPTSDRDTQMRQQEKLAALGKLSAGLFHELNNPAAAGRRAAKQLREALQSLQSRTLGLHDQDFSAFQRQPRERLVDRPVHHRIPRGG